MNVFREGIVGAVLLCACAGFVVGENAVEERAQLKVLTADKAQEIGHVHGDWCVHPKLRTEEEVVAQRRFTSRGTISENEIEPNDALGSGQLLNLGTGAGEEDAIDVAGDISAGTDEDEFRFNLRAGDIFGIAVNRVSSPILNPTLELQDDSGGVYQVVENGFTSFTLPPESPLPVFGFQSFEPVTQFIAPADGEYRVRIKPDSPTGGGSNGAYSAEFRVFRHPLESQLPATKQVIFVDFDGAFIDPGALFGSANPPVNLTPFAAFLPAWGLLPSDESAVIDEVLATIQARFDEMAGLNPSFNFELLNSRDHADPFGDPDVSRLIVGGTIAELGIATIGIAQWIDPGNFSLDDTAVTLLDELSTSGTGVAIHEVARDPSVSLIEAIGTVVGNISAHEAGHYLGCYHTSNTNGTYNIMDSGGGNSFQYAMTGSGDDGIMGTADDNLSRFVTDVFHTEGFAVGDQLCDQRISTALSSMGAAPCDGDANGDNTVDVNDISYVLFRLGNSGAPGTVDGDANGDGIVDVNDISYVLFRLGPC